MNRIYLGGKFSNLFALVDDEDYEHLSKFSWSYDGQGYATTRTSKTKLTMMHRMILNVSGYETKIDHINHNTLDNRKDNLRIVTNQQSTANRLPYSKSGYKGVRQKGTQWEANITINRKQKYLGHFETPEEAARVYDKEALSTFGECAYINFQRE